MSASDNEQAQGDEVVSYSEEDVNSNSDDGDHDRAAKAAQELAIQSILEDNEEQKIVEHRHEINTEPEHGAKSRTAKSGGKQKVKSKNKEEDRPNFMKVLTDLQNELRALKRASATPESVKHTNKRPKVSGELVDRPSSSKVRSDDVVDTPKTQLSSAQKIQLSSGTKTQVCIGNAA